jgi:hypothetical protein
MGKLLNSKYSIAFAPAFVKKRAQFHGISSNRVKTMRRLYYLLVFIALLAPAAAAETVVRGVYQTDFLGLPLSRAFVTMTYDAKAYHIKGTGRSSVMARILVPMKAAFSANGSLASGKTYPGNFEAQVKAGKVTYDISLSIRNGAIVKESASPPHDRKPDLVPVTEAMKHNVIDPLSAFLVPYATNAPEKVCARTLPIYTGRERFDLKLTFARKEKVIIPGFFDGEAQVCAARYIPLGGHRAKKKEIRYMIGNKEMEAWFVPLPDQPLMGLYKAEIGTKLGPLTVTLEKAGLGPAPGKKS